MKRRNISKIKHEKVNLTRTLEGMQEKQSKARAIDFVTGHKLLILIVIAIGAGYILLKSKLKGKLESRIREYAMLGGK